MEQSVLLQVAVPLGLFIIMLGLGSTLSGAALRDALLHRRALTAGLLVQLLGLPLAGMLIAGWAPIPLEFKLGILILACCPGGTTSNVFAHLARGNLALSVSLTTISSLASLVTMPLMLMVGGAWLTRENVAIDLPQDQIVKSLLALTVVPVCLGMLIRHYRSGWAQALERWITPFSSLFLAGLIAVITVREWPVLSAHIVTLAPLLLALSGLTSVLGLLAARLARVDGRDTVTIGLEAGIQNSGLAIFIALAVLGNELMTIPAAIYTLSMYVTALALVWVGRRWGDQEGQLDG